VFGVAPESRRHSAREEAEHRSYFGVAGKPEAFRTGGGGASPKGTDKTILTGTKSQMGRV